jgi:hypothetical protein
MSCSGGCCTSSNSTLWSVDALLEVDKGPLSRERAIFSPTRAVCGTIAAAMTADIITNAIVAALSAGAVAGTTDTAKAVIADTIKAYRSPWLRRTTLYP